MATTFPSGGYYTGNILSQFRQANPTEKAAIAAKQAQTQMAQEQWDWQKKWYEDMQKASLQGAGGLSSLVGQYNKAFGEAKSANEQRYQQMLDIINQTTGQRAADIRSQYGQQGSDIMQNLARLGMANTTVAPTMQFGVQREQQSALNRLADELQGTRLGVMERRTDKYPDIGLIATLAQGLGQAGGGGGIGAVLGALGGLRM